MTEFQEVAGLTDDEMRLKKAPRIINERRIMVLYMCYANGVKPTRIARLYGFHVSSIKYALRRCRDLYETDTNFRSEYNRLFTTQKT